MASSSSLYSADDHDYDHDQHVKDDDEHVKVERHLLKDIMQSTKPWIEELMTAGYKVILNVFIMVTIIIDNIITVTIDNFIILSCNTTNQLKNTQTNILL